MKKGNNGNIGKLKMEKLKIQKMEKWKMIK